VDPGRQRGASIRTPDVGQTSEDQAGALLDGRKALAAGA